MDLQKELDTIYARMFTEEILDKLIAIHKRESKRVRSNTSEEDYTAAMAALERCLNCEQKRILSEIEAASRRNIRRAMGLALTRGFGAGFRDAPVLDEPACPYIQANTEFIYLEMFCPSYHAGRGYLRDLYQDLYDQLDRDTQEYLVSVDVLWDDRLLGVFLLCYEMGYNQAFSLAGQTGHTG